MSKAQYQTKTFHVMSDFHLEELIDNIYAHDFIFCSDQLSDNDSIHEFSINGNIDQFDQERIDMYAATGEGDNHAHTLLNALCRDNIIPAGDWLITIG